jgi:hypothetical protein
MNEDRRLSHTSLLTVGKDQNTNYGIDTHQPAG